MQQTNINTGLTTSEAELLIKKYGHNKIEVKKENTVLKILISQFTSLIIIILLICAFIFLFMGDTLEFVLVLIIIVVNGLIGFAQEYKADRAVDSLKKMLVKTTLVLRDGEKQKLILKTWFLATLFMYGGDKVPADLKILENYSLVVDRSVLSGEAFLFQRYYK